MREYDGVDREQSDAVNTRLRLVPESGGSDRPECLLFRAGAARPEAGCL